MAHIVISYRRADTDSFAGRIRDKIADRFGVDSVFMDIDNIPFGRDFRSHIKDALGVSDVVIVVIGDKWLGTGKAGHARIQDETDPVRIEVETALQKGIPVIPVLAGDTRMPKPVQLPDTLKELAFINAATVDTGRDFHPHMERVLRSIEAILKGQPAEPPIKLSQPSAPVVRERWSMPRHVWPAVALVVSAGVIAAAIWWRSGPAILPGAPSWCANAAYAVEKIICSDASFFAKDQELTTLYKFILARRPDSQKAAFTNDQRDWLKDRNQCAGDDVKDCIRRKYDARIAQLKSEPTASGP